MEEKFRIDKEYTIPFNIFSDAYKAFQKKNVYPKSYLFMALFIVLAVVYIFAAVDDPSNMIAYFLIFICLALAVREWYNPRKIRRAVLDTIQSEGLENEVYKFRLGDDFVEISTLPHEDVENSDGEDENEDDVPDIDAAEQLDEMGYPLNDENPEPTRIPINSELVVSEYEEFFLLHVKKKMFYVVPKKNFSETEIGMIRGLNAAAGK